MAYTTLLNLEKRFGEQMLIDLTDRAEIATGAIDTDVVDAALADTDALIDGYLASRYTLPLSTPQPLIETLARDIAIYKLHVYQSDEKITADYKAAIRSLEGIAAGSIRLSADGIAPTQTGGSGARVTDRERPMTEDNMKGLI